MYCTVQEREKTKKKKKIKVEKEQKDVIGKRQLRYPVAVRGDKR